MWFKINFTLCICLFLAIENTNAVMLKSSYQLICESIFQLQCPFLVQDETKNQCEINIFQNTLKFYCKNQELDTPNFFGSCYFDDSHLLMMACIRGLEGLGSVLDKTQCNLPDEEYKRFIFKNCTKNNITFIEVKSFPKYITQIEYLDLLASSFPNLDHMNWSYCDKCLSLNEFLSKFKHLSIFSMFLCKNLIGCEGYALTNVTQIEEMQIVLDALDEDDIKNISFINETRIRGMESLKVLELSFPTKGYVIEIPSDLFKGLKNLRALAIRNCNITQLTEEHFEDLINLKTLAITGGSIDGSGWLRSTTILNKLVTLDLDEGVEVPDSNMSAFICQHPEFCRFNVDTEKKHCPDGCVCYLLKNTWQFVMRCTNSNITELPIPINGTSCLDFRTKNLTQLPKLTLPGYSHINEMRVWNNKLTNLTVDQLPPNLTYLDLRNNSLEYFDNKVIEFFTNRSGRISLDLSGNPWICNCDTVQTLDFIKNGSNNIIDRLDLKCSNEPSGLPIMSYTTDHCNSFLLYYILGALLGWAVIIIIALYTKQSVSMWLYERNLCLNWISRPEPKADTALRIDAFLAFSHVDLELIEEFVEKLEKGPRDYQLCFYHRDWLIGESIPDCILQSIEYSKRVIVLMTDNFIKSSWGLFEFRSAIKATSMDKNKRLIVILYPGVDIDKLDSELKLYMKFNTYLRRDDPLFWRKLMFAMPHKQVITDQPTQPAVEECQL